MLSTHPKWSEEEFIAFLLIYASYADLDFSQEEKSMIEKNVSQDQFEVLKTEYYSCAEMERLKIISSYKEAYFNTSAQQEMLLKSIQSLFEVDGEYDFFEKNFMGQLKGIILGN